MTEIDWTDEDVPYFPPLTTDQIEPDEDACTCGHPWDAHGYDSYANEPVCPESA